MNREEQNRYLSAEYADALRYMDNAKEALKKAEKRDDGYYRDKKYVETVCGVAYIGVLHALDAWLAVKGVPKPRKGNKSIDYYSANIARLDNKLLAYVNTAYNALHLRGYYRSELNVKAIESGFDAANYIIERIKPETFVPVQETMAQGIKRKVNNLMTAFAVMFR